jgi:uncharacterized linocin/CFP29 family protein
VDDALRKALHLLELRATLKEQKVYADRFKRGSLGADLRGCADQPRAQATVGDGVVFERDMLL